MTYTVHIKKNETGEIRIIPLDTEWHEISEWWWTEGNMACDCSRGDLFSRGDYPCGSFAYTAIKAVFEDGTEIILDDED